MPITFGDKVWQHSINLEVVELSGTATSNTKLAQYEDIGSYQASLAAELGVYGAYGVASAEASAKVEVAVQTALAQNSVIGKQETYRPLYLIRLADFTRGTEEFRGDVSLTFHGGMSMEQFIANYGTHVIQEVQVGGRLNVQVRMSSCLSSAERQKALQSKVCASYDAGAASAGGCAELGLDEATANKIENSIEDWDVVVEGGDPATCASKTACAGAAWLQSVNANSDSQVLSLKLRELTDYIPNTTQRAYIAQGLRYYIGNQSQSLRSQLSTPRPPADLCASGTPTTAEPQDTLSGGQHLAIASYFNVVIAICTFVLSGMRG